ncbi:hypothetical protein Tco_1225791 [Tanacetum coccineum]
MAGKGCTSHHWVHDVVFNVSNQLVILTAYRWIIASQDETTGPSVHPEDATSTKMVRETLSHADAESGGLAPSPVPATTYIPPTDKDLEILFQPMLDEYFDQSTYSEPVPTATVVNALTVCI